MSLNSFIFVRKCKKSDTKRDEGLVTPADIERFDNIQYGDNGKWNILDVYRPKDTVENGVKKKLPVIVSVHGGGWVYGDKEVYQYYCMNLAQRGFAVVNFTYRLAPKYKHPSAIEDTNSVFKWVLNNKDTYGFDVDNIFAVGDSAGAQNISIYAAILTHKEFAAKFDMNIPNDLKLKALGLNCGIYSIMEENHGLFNDYLPQKGSQLEKYQMSSVNGISSDYPPCYVLTASDDFLKDAAPVLLKKLDEYKVPYEFKIYGDEENKLYHVFHCDVKSDAAKAANDDECNFFKKYIS